jgi:hypothetical protein
MEILGILAVAALAIAALAISPHLKAKRRAAFRGFAFQHGLDYAEGDPFGLLGSTTGTTRRARTPRATGPAATAVSPAW